MGNLVFQATLGGQVNLVGPNTASTFNLNVPAVAGTLVTTGDTGTVTNTMCATSVYTAPGTIGSGTPNSGAFTTLSASSTTTLSGGTANGVAYLNGSKVVTTGSALVFDGANLGLGVTPSAWFANSRVLQLGAGALVEGRSNDSAQGTFGAGYYLDSSATYRYIGSTAATRFVQASGAYLWFNAPSGTAGNAITFTQAMTLDASSRLGISNTSPSVDLEIGSNSSTVRALAVRYSSVPAYLSNSFDGSVGLSTLSANTYNTSSGSSSWSSFQNTAYGAAAVQVVSSTAGGEVRFLTASGSNTNPSERARIDSSGVLLIGLTSAFNGTTSPLQVGNNAANQTLSLRNANATPYGQYIFYSGASPNNTANEFLYCSDTTAQRFTARSNGGLANYSGNNVNLSDRREKTNFAPAKSYLDTICAIPVQTFNYIDQNMEEDPGLTLGVVAQDVQAVAPELVSESNWGTKEEPKMRLSIYQTDLQYALMKCIQEQQAIITQLQADVAALKGQA